MNPMTSPIEYPVDDKDLDDAALWAVIDSASAASLSSPSKTHKHLGFKYNNNNNHRQSPLPISYPSPPVPKLPQNSSTRNHYSGEKKTRSIIEGKVLDDPESHHRPRKMTRTCVSEVSKTSLLAMVNHVLRTPTAPSYSSPESMRFSGKENSHIISDFSPLNCGEDQEKETTRHSLSGRFPSDAFQRVPECSYGGHELEKLLNILRLPHDFLSIDLSIDAFSLMVNEMQEKLSCFIFQSTCFSEMQKDFLPNFMLCNTVQRFVRSPKVPLAPIKKPSLTYAKENFYCGTQVILVDWVKRMARNRQLEVVLDPNIRARPTTRALKRALLITLRCIDPVSTRRPTMSEVVRMLASEEYPIPKPMDELVEDTTNVTIPVS